MALNNIAQLLYNFKMTKSNVLIITFYPIHLRLENQFSISNWECTALETVVIFVNKQDMPITSKASLCTIYNFYLTISRVFN